MAATAELNVVSEDTNHGGLEKWLVRTPTTAAAAEVNVVGEDTNHGGNGRIECG